MHQHNATDWAIQTSKNNLVVGLVILPESFPMENWYKITKQSDNTLNTMQPFLQNPALSALKAL